MHPNQPELVQRAIALRGEGYTYAQIAQELGVNRGTAYYWGNPEAAEANRKRGRERWSKGGDDFKQRRRDQLRTRYHAPENRFKYALYAQSYQAKRGNYAPCLAPEAEVAAAWTGQCHICGRSDDHFEFRLHLDHCHETGKFRGWLCHPCNVGLGMLDGQLSNAMRYLNHVSAA